MNIKELIQEQFPNSKHANTIKVAKLIDDKFIVRGSDGEFSWIVHGTRLEIETEPYKKDCVIKGEPPYTWIQ